MIKNGVLNMSYETLLKISRKCGAEEYKKQYMIRSQGPSTYHLPLSIRGNEKENNLFFICTIEMMQKINNIIKLNSNLNTILYKLPTVAVEQYKINCLIQEILKTNEIEGVRSTKAEIKEAINSNEEKQKRFVGLAKKYVLLDRIEEEIPLKKSQDIRDLYDEIVLKEIEEEDYPDGAIFRKDSVDVLSPTLRVLHSGVMPESNIIKKMDEALEFLNYGECDGLIKIAIFHYYFGYIHPFYDGNGRVSRFISSYLISKHLNPLISFNLSLVIKENIKKYYQGFMDCNEKMNQGDITPFCLMFLAIIEESLNDVVAELEDKAETLKHCRSLLDEISDIEILEKQILFVLMQVDIFDGDNVGFKDLLRIIGDMTDKGISETTLRKYLKSLDRKGYLNKKKEGRRDIYSINSKIFEVNIEE
ncbi:Fic family protein [Turicibacter sanguinis]|nr:Fic family protein [Turicibacter sanguinis]MTN52106.1 Fic family protein [Turicibacter sanguinis]MTN55142.1 Fic family protein [Turicibacter sanguinis]MTN58349.1 Fic family protein [Turicibacter sanguinis]MTN61461.1 Fic family protein [Turicibacter sanguinis]